MNKFKKCLSLVLLCLLSIANFACQPQEVVEINTELFVAICERNTARLSEILSTPQYQQYIDINMTYDKAPLDCAVPGDTLFIAAIKAGSSDMATTIYSSSLASIDLGKTDSFGRNALHWAATTCNQNVAVMLMNTEIDKNATDNAGETAVQLSNKAQCPEIGDYILQSQNQNP